MSRKKPEEITLVNHCGIDEAVDKILSENTGLLLDVQRNIPYAINKLVAEVMRRTTVKVDPKKVRQLILSKM